VDATKKDKDEEAARRQGAAAAGPMAGGAAAKPSAISGQRRKVIDRGTLDNTPDTNRAVGGSDRILRR
jgi:casein kinase I family protein HRR25